MLHVVRDLPPVATAPQPRQRRGRASLLRPRRQQRRQHRAAGPVRVLVEREIDVRARLVEKLEQRVDQRLVRGRLQVRDVQRRARPPGHLDELADRSQYAATLVADVRDERRPELGRHLGERHELVRLGVRPGQIEQPERQRPGACLEPEPHLVLHAPQLGRRRRPALPAHDGVANRVVPDRRHQRRRRPRLVERGQVLRERRPRPLHRAAALEPAQVGLPFAAALGIDRCRRQAVRVDQLGREALCDLRLEQRLIERAKGRVGVHVHEAGAEHEAAGVHDLARVDVQRRLDGLDPLADERDVGDRRRPVAGVHERTPDQDIGHRPSRKRRAEPRPLAPLRPRSPRPGEPAEPLRDPPDTRREPVAERRRPRERPQPEREALRARRDAALDEILPQLEQQLVERDLHRASVGARAAQRRGVRQRGRVVEPDEQRQEHRAHRARVDRAVRGAAGLPVDRADVQAGAAADAREHLAVLRAEQVRAAVVDDHDVQLLGPVLLARPPRPGQERRVDAEPLPRAAAGEQPEQHGEIGQVGDEPLHAHQRDVHARERADQAAVALVRDQADGAGRADAEVGAGDADVGVEEDLPQLAARRLRERLELRWHGHALDGREQRGRVLGRLLDRRREDVHRVLAGELDDVLAEISLDDADSGRLQRVVQADLLRQHRLRLRRELGAGATADVGDVGGRVVGGAREVDAAAAGLERVPETVDVSVQVVDHPHPRVVGALPQLLDLGQRLPRLGPVVVAGGRSRSRGRPGCDRPRA